MTEQSKRVARTPRSLAYSYKEYLWGDLISGSKNAIQRLGIGVGIAFPGEKGAPKYVQTIDPRGFPCEIQRSIDTLTGFAYDAKIFHPGREYQFIQAVEVFPGVILEETTHYDILEGGRESLVAGGFVLPGRFPGDPGMGKGVVNIRADGSIGPKYLPEHPGSKTIRKTGVDKFLVYTVITEAQGYQRLRAERIRRADYEARMAALPRASRIDIALQKQLMREAERRRAKLRLVWSKPEFEPGLNPLPDGPYRCK